MVNSNERLQAFPPEHVVEEAYQIEAGEQQAFAVVDDEELVAMGHRPTCGQNIGDGEQEMEADNEYALEDAEAAMYNREPVSGEYNLYQELEEGSQP